MLDNDIYEMFDVIQTNSDDEPIDTEDNKEEPSVFKKKAGKTISQSSITSIIKYQCQHCEYERMEECF